MSDSRDKALSFYYEENGRLEEKVKKMQAQIDARDEYIYLLEEFINVGSNSKAFNNLSKLAENIADADNAAKEKNNDN
jgi:hypothetical protein